jgi:hypothetical protein
MTISNNDIKNLLKSELDDTLFESLDFQPMLKNEVKNKIKPIKKQMWIYKFWNKRVVIPITVGAVISIVFFSTLLSQPSDSKPTENKKMNTFVTEGENTNLIKEQRAIKSWDLDSPNELKQWLGKEILVPSYSPKGFRLDRIQVTGTSKDKANKVVFSYFNDDQSYLVMIERETFKNKPLGFESVELTGVTGYLRKGETDVELEWNQKGYHYMVGGLITSEEAIKIAESFK